MLHREYGDPQVSAARFTLVAAVALVAPLSVEPVSGHEELVGEGAGHVGSFSEWRDE
jgi:hypothetical protein